MVMGVELLPLASVVNVIKSFMYMCVCVLKAEPFDEQTQNIDILTFRPEISLHGLCGGEYPPGRCRKCMNAGAFSFMTPFAIML